MTMQLAFAPPPPDLAALVSIFYLYRCDDAVVEGVERADVGQIRFMLKGAGTLIFPGGYSEPSTPIMVNGPGTGAASYRVGGPFHCFGVALRPIGWGALIGMPADSRADHVTDGGTVFGAAGLALLERLRGLATLDEMVAAAVPFLNAVQRPVPAEHHRLAETVRVWLAGGAADIADLFAAVPWSPRHVTRIVNRYFGAPPKLLVRKFRALRAATRLVEGDDPAAVAEPFYDQSHMIREIRHFTGHTPGALASAMDPVLAMTLASSAYNELSAVNPPRHGEGDHSLL